MKLSLPRASTLNENVDHSALLKHGGTVSERVNRFDSKAGGDGGGFSKLQETRRIFEQRTLQVRNIMFYFVCLMFSSPSSMNLFVGQSIGCSIVHVDPN